MKIANELVTPILGNASNNIAFLDELGHFHEHDEDGFAIGEVCRDEICTLGLSDDRVENDGLFRRPDGRQCLAVCS
jgi:hypothetical protein